MIQACKFLKQKEFSLIGSQYFSKNTANIGLISHGQKP